MLAPSLALVAALMRDKEVAACASDAGTAARAYVAQAFSLKTVTLRSREHMTVAIAQVACLARGQSNRIMIFERVGGGYRRVLDEVTLPDFAQVGEDGTVVLPTHETMETIFEAAYVWNGDRYAYSDTRSHVYDVPLEQRRPSEVPVVFAPGRYGTTLSGSVAFNFGENYVFQARAGQTATIELVKHAGRRPWVELSYGNESPGLADLGSSDRWIGKLPRAGAYKIVVFGEDDTDSTRISEYTLRLSIH